jgi:hypothetical protein
MKRRIEPRELRLEKLAGRLPKSDADGPCFHSSLSNGDPVCRECGMTLASWICQKGRRAFTWPMEARKSLNDMIAEGRHRKALTAADRTRLIDDLETSVRFAQYWTLATPWVSRERMLGKLRRLHRAVAQLEARLAEASECSFLAVLPAFDLSPDRWRAWVEGLTRVEDEAENACQHLEWLFESEPPSRGPVKDQARIRTERHFIGTMRRWSIPPLGAFAVAAFQRVIRAGFGVQVQDPKRELARAIQRFVPP